MSKRQAKRINMTTIRIDQRIILILLFFFLFSVLDTSNVTALQMTNIAVPEVVDIRDTATLSCTYNMGKHKLNSVKWYKNEMEFYRYSPMTHPTVMTFPVVGVNLPISEIEHTFNCNRATCTVTLDHLSPKTSGAYRCEISGDAPEFKLIGETANMTIAAIPKLDPIISGLAQNYMDGDSVIANCTSDMSNPAANLMWYINDESAPLKYLQPQHETTVDLDGFQLQYRSLEIRFQADKTYFTKTRGTIKLRCVAKIEQIPSATREISAIIYVTSMDELTNQKLVNWLSRANTCRFDLYATNKISIIFLFSYLILKTIFHFDAS